MSNPRDSGMIRAVFVHPVTQREVTDGQQMRLRKLREASLILRQAMHEAIGEQFDPFNGPHAEEGDTYGSRKMAIAATHLDTALLFAYEAAMESR